MPIVRTGESAYDKELARWDRPRNQFVLNEQGQREYGMNAVGFEKYPQTVYMAYRAEHHGGKAMCRDISDLYTSDPVKQAQAIAFTAKCERVVRNEDEYQKAIKEGWRDTQEQALERLEAFHQDMAKAAAEAAYSVQRMSQKARDEYDAHDANTEAPATDVPAPKKAPRMKRVAVA